MEIRCRCPACQAKFKVDAKYAGKKARCPKCQAVIEVPRENLEESTVMSLPSLPPPPYPAAGGSPSGSFVAPPAPNLPTAGKSGVFIPPAPVAGGPAAAFGPLPSGAPLQPAFVPQQAAAQQPAPQQPAFNLNQPAAQPDAPLFSTAPATSHAPASAGSRPPKKGASQSSLLPQILGGGLAAAALVGIGVGIAILSRGGDDDAPKPIRKPKPGYVAATGSATLIIDWPAGERSGASLIIDGQKKPVSASGPLKFLLSAGSHRLILQRRGFEPVEKEISLAAGKTENFSPQWRSGSVAAPVAGSFSPPASTGSNSPPTNSGFPIGTAVASLSPKGFDGWLQNLDMAKRQAAEGAKNLLIVFGCSDAQSATRELAQRLGEAGVKNNQVCVIIDFPRTEDGYNIVEDTAQNQQLLEDFGIDRLPVLVLADERGRTFFLKRDWDDGFANLQQRIVTWTAERTRRDELLAAAAPSSAEKLPAAAAAVKWLQENKVWRFYGPEISGWHAVAQKADPENQQTLLETFFEPRWFIDVDQVNEEDATAVGRVTAQLDPWVSRGGFKDQDRGAKLHMTAAMLLAKAERFEDATKQLEQAVKYQPKDAKLADALNGLKTRLENKDILGNGTGYLVSSAGYIMTNHHVIDGPGRVEVRVPGTNEFLPAQVIAQDERRDMALLKINIPASLALRPVAVVKDDTGLASEVAAFGFPLSSELGSSLKFTKGSISDLPGGTNDKYILDVKVNPGNSGGPLCNTSGNVVGMVTAKTSNTQLEDSYGLAIPAEVLLEFLDAHMPTDAPRAEPTEAPEVWTAVAKKMTSSVLMIVKKK